MGEMADYYLDQCFDPYYYEETDTEYDDSVFFPREKPRGPGPCPICGFATVLKTGIHGQFYGCSQYPGCRGSRNI